MAPVAKKSLKMKDELFKQVKDAKNSAKAGDAVLAFYYDSVKVKDVEIVRDQQAPLGDKYFHGKWELTLWGPSVGFKKIPLLGHGSFLDSLQALKFEEKEIKCYTHFIMNGIKVSYPGVQEEFVTIWRLNHLDYSEIVTGYF